MTLSGYSAHEEKLESAKDFLESHGYMVFEPDRADEFRRKWHALGVMIQQLKDWAKEP